MRIEAAGKTWIVEERELAPGITVAPGRFFGVTFRREGHDEDIVQVRWVIKPTPLTSREARELFEVAPVRLWRDPRDGAVYRLSLESSAADGGDGGAVTETLTFQTEEGSVSTAYRAGHPLSFASDSELVELLDRARTGW
ncbi:MAG: hypothetical protein KY453_02795 [Gemmatimonadetes bacterium]|nr:hypothetical protein [Gemmatimonadota bacterium]